MLPFYNMSDKFYRIGEAAELLNLKSYVLRFWETEFSQLLPERTDKGQRFYSEENMTLLKRIKFLLHERGLTIEGAKKILEEELLNGKSSLSQGFLDFNSESNKSLNSGAELDEERQKNELQSQDPKLFVDQDREFEYDNNVLTQLTVAHLRLKNQAAKTLNFLEQSKLDFGNGFNSSRANSNLHADSGTSSSLNNLEENLVAVHNTGQNIPQNISQNIAHNIAQNINQNITQNGGQHRVLEQNQLIMPTQAEPQALSSNNNVGAVFVQGLLSELEELRRILKS